MDGSEAIGIQRCCREMDGWVDCFIGACVEAGCGGYVPEAQNRFWLDSWSGLAMCFVKLQRQEGLLPDLLSLPSLNPPAQPPRQT